MTQTVKRNVQGLGDVVHLVIHAVAPNVKHCQKCEQRRKNLNRLFPFKRQSFQ